MDEVLVERVLRAVELVPEGRVVCYGDLAGLAGTGPRQVGAIMRDWGSGVAWWRVTSRQGRLPAELLRRAQEHWHAEGIGLAPDGKGCRFTAYRADLARLADDHARATAGLPDAAG